MKRSKIIVVILLTILTFSCDRQMKEKENTQSLQTGLKKLNTKSDTSNIIEKQKESKNEVKQENILKQFDKKVQTFLISTQKDTIIRCKEGTSIKFLKNSLINEKTGEEITGKVKISVKEYYKLSDMVLANLSTTSDGKLLETGGMINISATSAGQKCILKKGEEIEIGFPTSNKKNDMQLFSGEWENNNVDWKPLGITEKEDIGVVDDTINTDSSNYQTEDSFYIIVENPAKPIGGYPRLYDFFAKKIYYPFSALAKKIEGKVYVEFVVDQLGEIKNVNIKKGLDPALDKAAYDVVSKMSKWKPAIQRGFPVTQRIVIPINFSFRKIKLTERAIRKSKKYEEYLKEVKVVYGRSGFSPLPTFKETFENKINEKTIKKTNISRIENYLFSSSQLGWINCDRFYNDRRQKINYSVRIREYDKTTVMLIFHSVKSLMAGSYHTNRVQFSNIPLGEKITIVAFKKIGNQRFLAIKDTKISKKGESNLEFEPITMANLKAGLAKIDGINY